MFLFYFLQEKYQLGHVSPEILVKLQGIASACSIYDFRTAQKAVVELAKMDWANTKDWQKGIRHIVTLGLIKSG